MKKTPLLIAAALCIAGLGAFAWQGGSGTEVGVSKVKGNPDAFLGKVKITGKVGGVDPSRGLLQIVDEKACCDLVLAVPFDAQQQADLGAEAVYAGTLPQSGQPIEAHGVLRKEKEGYRLDLSKVTSGGKVLVRKV